MYPHRTVVFQAAETYYESLISEIRGKLAQSQEQLNQKDESTTLDDQAQAGQLNEDQHRESEQLTHAEAALNALKRIDHQDNHEVVQAGTVVHTDHGHFLVGVAVPHFEVEGEKYLGISKQAPIFAAMAGKKQGEQFEVRGITYTIEHLD